jgi:hypothetical protein
LRREEMPEAPVTVSVAKVVKLGADTLLVIAVPEGANVPEGEYTIRSIDARLKAAGPGGANCGIQITL